jgi:hypothetical protein
MRTTQQEIGQHFAIEELQAVGAMVASLPFGGTSWKASPYQEAIPELITITPPRCDDVWRFVWKHRNGLIIVEATRCQFGSYKTDCERYGRMAEALAAIRWELVWGKRPGRAT